MRENPTRRTPDDHRRLSTEVVKLQAANKKAVDRASALQIENESLKRKVEDLRKERDEFRKRWEAAHAKVPA